ncbi:MAG: hypothetical protein ACK4WM_00395 [Thermoflexales bacterium]
MRGWFHALLASIIALLPLVCLSYCSLAEQVNAASRHARPADEWCHPFVRLPDAHVAAANGVSELSPGRRNQAPLSQLAELAGSLSQVALPMVDAPWVAVLVIWCGIHFPTLAQVRRWEPPPLPPPERELFDLRGLTTGAPRRGAGPAL